MLTKSEQDILNAFSLQKTKGYDPRFVATKVIGRSGTTGNRKFRAAESLVRKGLARVIAHETDPIRGRGGLIREVTLTVGPPDGGHEAREEQVATKETPPKRKRPRATRKREAPTPDWPTILRDHLKSSAMSDSEIARATGIPQPTITRFRNGTRSLSFANAAKLAAKLGFTFLPPK